MDGPFLSLPQLTAYSGLSRSTLKRHMAAARDALPCYRVGGRVLVRQGEFEAWMQSKRQSESAVRAKVRRALGE
jgi:predicted DNA-binding transcriptional regulator AlpA